MTLFLIIVHLPIANFDALLSLLYAFYDELIPLLLIRVHIRAHAYALTIAGKLPEPIGLDRVSASVGERIPATRARDDGCKRLTLAMVKPERRGREIVLRG